MPDQKPILTSAPQSLRHHTIRDATTTVSKNAPALGDFLLYKTPWSRTLEKKEICNHHFSISEDLCGKFLIVPQSDSCFRLDPPLNQREEGDVIKIPQTTQREPFKLFGDLL